MSKDIINNLFSKDKEDGKALSKSKTPQSQPEALPAEIVSNSIDTKELYHKVDTRKLKVNQRKFLQEFCTPLHEVKQNGKTKLRVNSIHNICNKLNIALLSPFDWTQKSREFKILFERIQLKRQEYFNHIAESKLMDNILSSKEVSLLFYLKNAIPDKYRDDTLLNQIYLRTNAVNFNYVKTEVAGLDNEKLVALASSLSSQLKPTEGRGGEKIQKVTNSEPLPQNPGNQKASQDVVEVQDVGDKE